MTDTEDTNTALSEERHEVSRGFWGSLLHSGRYLDKTVKGNVTTLFSAAVSASVAGIPALIDDTPKLWGNKSISERITGEDWKPVRGMYDGMQDYWKTRGEAYERSAYGEVIKSEGMLDSAAGLIGDVITPLGSAKVSPSVANGIKSTAKSAWDWLAHTSPRQIYKSKAGLGEKFVQLGVKLEEGNAKAAKYIERLIDKARIRGVGVDDMAAIRTDPRYAASKPLQDIVSRLESINTGKQALSPTGRILDTVKEGVSYSAKHPFLTASDATKAVLSPTVGLAMRNPLKSFAGLALGERLMTGENEISGGILKGGIYASKYTLQTAWDRVADIGPWAIDKTIEIAPQVKRLLGDTADMAMETAGSLTGSAADAMNVPKEQLEQYAEYLPAIGPVKPFVRGMQAVNLEKKLEESVGNEEQALLAETQLENEELEIPETIRPGGTLAMAGIIPSVDQETIGKGIASVKGFANAAKGKAGELKDKAKDTVQDFAGNSFMKMLGLDKLDKSMLLPMGIVAIGALVGGMSSDDGNKILGSLLGAVLTIMAMTFLMPKGMLGNENEQQVANKPTSPGMQLQPG